MNFYDILAAEKMGGGIPTINFFDLLFSQSISGEQWQVYDGTLPATINANGSDLRQYQAWGNTGGVGDKTVNLFDYTQLVDKYTYDPNNGQMILNPDVDNRWRYSAIPLIQVTPGSAYLRTWNLTPWGNYVNYYDSEKNFIAQGSPGTGNPFTVPNNCYFISFVVETYSSDRKKYMLTEGSTPPASFVPFGYEVDMVTGSNILQSSEIEWGGWQAAAETIPSKIVNPARCRSKNMYPISGEKIFYNFKSLNVNIAFIKSDERSLGGTGFKIGAGSVDVPADAVKCLFIIANTDIGTNITPAQVIAAGIWASVDTTTTPIYIGDEPLEKVGNYADYVDYQKQKVVREIKKYVFDGTENWEQVLGADGDSTKNYFRFALSSATYLNANFSRCSHFTWQWINTSTTTVGFRTYIPTGSNAILFVVRPENVEDMGLSDFKSWLAEQYTAGTPVTVWCALTVADEADPPVTLPVLPTVEGETVIDYAGESVAPEKVYFEYQGGKKP